MTDSQLFMSFSECFGENQLSLPVTLVKINERVNKKE